MKNEPILNWGMVVAFVTALIAVLTTVFGLPLDEAGVKAIVALTVAAGPLVTALVSWQIARQRTWPDRKVVRVAPDVALGPEVGLNEEQKAEVSRTLQIVEDLKHGRQHVPRSNAEERPGARVNQDNAR